MTDQQALLNVIQAEELVERLRLAAWPGVFTAPVNPDGPEAAELIETLLSATADLTRQLAEAREALGEAREAIASLPEDALGYDDRQNLYCDPHPPWPLRDELLDRIDRSLTSKEEHHGE